VNGKRVFTRFTSGSSADANMNATSASNKRSTSFNAKKTAATTSTTAKMLL